MAKDGITFPFCPGAWLTPNTYDRNFCMPVDAPGVYLIIKPHYDVRNGTTDNEVLYVGSAKSISVRYRSHSVLRILKEFYGYIQFHFMEAENYREVEKDLIKRLQPKFNKQWR